MNNNGAVSYVTTWIIVAVTILKHIPKSVLFPAHHYSLPKLIYFLQVKLHKKSRDRQIGLCKTSLVLLGEEKPLIMGDFKQEK